jgi:hypothetical protein
MPSSEDSQRSSDTLARLSEDLGRSVVPIFTIGRRGKPEGCGTGLLVSRNDQVFLVTAGHVIGDHEYNKKLFFYVNRNTTRNLLASFRKTFSLYPDHKDDRLDIAVLRLDGFNSLPFGKSVKRPLPFSALKPFATPRDKKHYLVTGFPGSKSRYHVPSKLVRSAPYAAYCMSAELEYQKYNFLEETHIALNFDQRDVHAGDFGHSLNFPDPRGMSGSPVWLLFDENGNNPIDTPVVGIMIEHRSDKRLLIATDIAIAIDIIVREFSK